MSDSWLDLDLDLALDLANRAGIWNLLFEISQNGLIDMSDSRLDLALDLANRVAGIWKLVIGIRRRRGPGQVWDFPECIDHKNLEPGTLNFEQTPACLLQLKRLI